MLAAPREFIDTSSGSLIEPESAINIVDAGSDQVRVSAVWGTLQTKPPQVIDAVLNDLDGMSLETLKSNEEDDTEAVPQFEFSKMGEEASFYALQEWEGYIIGVEEDKFLARLVDLTGGSNNEGEIVEFPMSDVADGDLDLVREGAVFRWAIGYLIVRPGTRWRTSNLIFRRLPQVSKTDIEEANREAEELSAALNAK